MAWGIRYVEAVGISLGDATPPPAGAWLRSYDPEAYGGRGIADWTVDPAKAMRFKTGSEAMVLYTTRSRTRPSRPDGKPNRPLTAFTVSVEQLP